MIFCRKVKFIMSIMRLGPCVLGEKEDSPNTQAAHK